MSHSNAIWTSDLHTGSKVFIKRQDGCLCKAEVTNVADHQFEVAGISSSFNKTTATCQDGFTALPNSFDIQEQYSLQVQRDYLVHLDIDMLNDAQIRHLYAGLHLAKKAGGGALPGLPMVETESGLRTYLKKVKDSELSDLQIMYMLTGLKIANGRE